jgi:hypothetical protein
VTTCVWVVLLVYAFMFSGSPYRSQAYKLKMRKLALAVFIWCMARYLRGITGAFEEKCYQFVLESLTKTKNTVLAIPLLCILFFVVQEVIPILFVLDWSFMEIFVISGDGQYMRNMAFTGIYDIMRSYEL